MSRTNAAFLKAHPEWVTTIKQGAKIAWDALVAEKSCTEYGYKILQMTINLGRRFTHYLYIYNASFIEILLL